MGTIKNVAEDFKRFCEKMNFDLNLNAYKSELCNCQKAKDMFVLGNQFFYIFDFTTNSIVYVHPNIEEIIGFSKTEFQDSSRIFELTHLDDREFVNELTKRTLSYVAENKAEILNEPFKSVFSIDYRVQHKMGHYLKLNRQACCYKTDKEGNMVLGFLLFTDVSKLNKGESYNINWIGVASNPFKYDDIIKKYHKDYKITEKEKYILIRLANGDNTRKIATLLDVSSHTIISHRKNLLYKTQTKNTAELVRFAVERNLI